MNLESLLENTINKSTNYYTKKDTDYEKDGKIYCGICHEVKLETKYLLGKPLQLPCYCKCQREEDEIKKQKFTEQDNYIQYLSNREKCFSNKEMYNNTFKNSDPTKHLDYCKKWAEDFNKDFTAKNSILLYGDVGTGKSHLANCIANAILLKNFTVKMTDFAEIERQQFSSKDKYLYYKLLNECDLLIIDDLGIERNSSYMQEIVFTVINERLKVNKPIIITTNLELNELATCSDIDKYRTYDRLIGCCDALEFRGKSRRLLNKIKNKQ